jgi:hypothetical protein
LLASLPSPVRPSVRPSLHVRVCLPVIRPIAPHNTNNATAHDNNYNNGTTDDDDDDDDDDYDDGDDGDDGGDDGDDDGDDGDDDGGGNAVTGTASTSTCQWSGPTAVRQ